MTSDVVGAGTDYPLPYTTRGQQRGLAPAPLGNVLSGRLRDVNAVTVDLDAAGLVRDGLRLEVGVDRPVTLRLLSGGRADTVALQPAGQG